MAGGKAIRIFIPNYVCTTGGSLYGLVAWKPKRRTEPLIDSNRIPILFRKSCTAAERFVLRWNCLSVRVPRVRRSTCSDGSDGFMFWTSSFESRVGVVTPHFGRQMQHLSLSSSYLCLLINVFKQDYYRSSA